MLTQIQNNAMFSTGLEILHEIESHGFQAYFVGGCCRDLILGLDSHDVDICTNAPMEILDEMFISHDIGANRTFGIIVVNRNGFSFEIAQMREDSLGSDGRRPDSVQFVNSLEEDVKRRDLTINSLALDSKGNIHDHVDGLKDLRNKIIRAVGDAQTRFEEDGLRICRAVRFTSRFNFNLCEKTKEAIKNNLHMLDKISPERIKDELWKMASQKGEIFAHSLELMHELGILEKILPEIAEQEAYLHCAQHHPESPTVWGHTIAAVRANKIADPIVNISILTHDAGKPSCYEFRDGWRHSYFRHEFVSGKVIERIARRLKFSNEEKEAIIFAAVNHMKFHHIEKMKTSKIVELMKSPHFELLKQVCFCDDSCRLHLFDQERWNSLIQKITEIESSFGKTMKQTKVVDGRRVMELTGLKSSKLLGDIIKETTAWVFDSGETSQEAIDSKVLELFNQKRD